MKYIISESQYARFLLSEQKNIDSLALKLIRKANSFFVWGFTEYYTNEYNAVKQHIDVDSVLNEMEKYIDSLTPTIWNEIKLGQSPNKTINLIYSKLNSLTLNEYNNLGRIKKFMISRLAKSKFKTKNDLNNYLINDLYLKFRYDDYGAIIRQIFERIKNWLIDDIKGLDLSTKQKIQSYYEKAASYINSTMKNTYASLINTVSTDIYS
jgi:hypothetical protein